MNPSSAILLLSGGMDSTVLMYDLIGSGWTVHCLTFDYGQTHRKEIEYARKQAYRMGVPFNVITFPTKLRGSTLTGDKGDFVVPFRNPLMLSYAINFAVAARFKYVMIGCNKDDAERFPDCRKGAMTAMNGLIAMCGYEVEVLAPYIEWSKAMIARLGSDHKVPMSDTWSCYRGGDEPCGECLACKTRAKALQPAAA